jgi:hypothetical protein
MLSEIRRRVLLLFVLAFFASLVPNAAKAACHAVTIAGSGSKSGADWNNAMANLPSSLVRGDTYFLADGSGYRIQSIAAESGTTMTYVKKAVPAVVAGSAVSAHCTDAGWIDALMGVGQAVFSGSPAVDLTSAGYFTLDGQTRASLTSGHGIRLDSSSCSGRQCYALLLGFNGGSKAHNITVQYAEFQQSNPGGGSNFDQDYGVYAYNNDGGAPNNKALHDITLQYNYHHNSACDFIFTRGVTNFTVQYSYLYLNNGGGTCHGQNWEDNNSTNIVARYNVFNESRGTAVVVVLCDICSGGNIVTNGFYVYGNVFYDSPGGSGWTANGTVACLGPSIACTNMAVYNNTFANLQNNGAGAGSNTTGINVNGASASPVCENNIFYNISSTMNFSIDCGSGEDYNSVIASGDQSSIFHGPHDKVDASNVNLFVAAVVALPLVSNFHLTAETSSDYVGGVTLGAPFNQSCDGTPTCGTMISRGAGGKWDRGAFQFDSGTVAQLPPVPQNVHVTNVQ